MNFCPRRNNTQTLSSEQPVLCLVFRSSSSTFAKLPIGSMHFLNYTFKKYGRWDLFKKRFYLKATYLCTSAVLFLQCNLFTDELVKTFCVMALQCVECSCLYLSQLLSPLTAANPCWRFHVPPWRISWQLCRCAVCKSQEYLKKNNTFVAESILKL